MLLSSQVRAQSSEAGSKAADSKAADSDTAGSKAAGSDASASDTATSQAATNQAAAQALFESGRKLMGQGRYAEACPKLAESQRLAPALGTRFNLADCYERLGRLASAWVHYVGVADAAARTVQPEREAFARERAARLKPRLSRLRIVVTAPLQGLTIKRDTIEVGAAQWGEALPLDAGRHRIEASAPGHVAWSREIEISGEGTTATLQIPALQRQRQEPPPTPHPAPPAPGPAQPVPTPSPQPVPAPGPHSTPERSTGLNGVQIGALIAGSAGLVGLGVGTGFGIFAKTKKDQAAPRCPRPDACFADGVALIEEAQLAADVSTASFVVGGVLAATGVVLWLAAPGPEKDGSASVGLAPARQGLGMGLYGSW